MIGIGKTVTWLFRKSGKGAGQFISPKSPPGYRNAGELANTRFLTSLFISGLKEKSWWDYFLWDTAVGKTFFKLFEKSVLSMFQAEADFDGRIARGARESFKLLKIDASYETLFLENYGILMV
jgi:hypothetical protein